jgi:hypothetical protein
MALRSELVVPKLSATIAARNVQVFECPRCIAQEDYDESVELVVQRAKVAAPPPPSFLDYPDERRPMEADPEYSAFVDRKVKPLRGQVQLGGYAHAGTGSVVRAGCGHRGPVLQFDSTSVGCQGPFFRLATAICLQPACRAPRVEKELELVR